MILAIVGNEPLGAAVCRALEEAGESPVLADAADDDLFDRATGCRTVVYAPAARLLEGTLDPAPDQERMRAVLAAANAPGVELVALIRPAAAAWSDEESVLRRSGKPYVVLRAPPLLEEIGTAAQLGAMSSVSVPRNGRARAALVSSVTERLLGALADDEMQGRCIDIPGEALDAVDLLRRAAATLGHPIDVAGASPTGMKIRRALARLFGRPQQSAHDLVERLGAAYAAESTRA